MLAQLLAGDPSSPFPQCTQMTKSYLNFVSVVSNLAWLAAPGTLKIWRGGLSVYV